MSHEEWFRDNLAAFEERLAPIRQQPPGVLFQKVTPTHIVIVDRVRDRIRLSLPCPVSNLVQSILHLDHPLRLVATYNQAFILGMLWRPEPRRIYTTGVGGGCFQTVLHHHLPQLQLDCADTDPLVIQAAHQFFGMPDDARLDIAVADARADLQARQAIYDLIYVDVFTGRSQTPYHLVTQEFYTLCHKRLHPEGALIINMLADEPFYEEKVRTVQAVFKGVYVCRVSATNHVVIGTDMPPFGMAEALRRARALQSTYRFEFAVTKWAERLLLPAELWEVFLYLEEKQVLSDDNRPSDYDNPAKLTPKEGE